MATSFTALRDSFKQLVRFYKTPITYTDDMYNFLLEEGIKRYYIDLGISSKYSSEYTEIPNQDILVDYDLDVQEYIKTSAKIGFFNQVKGDVAQLVSYTTNAISIAGGNKPYEHMNTEVVSAENKLTELFFKITEGAGSKGA